MDRPNRVLIIGLDCAEPGIMFRDGGRALPAVHRMMNEGCWGRLRSTDPPLTIPAWTAMLSGQHPGTLGFYGFRMRKNYTYSDMSIAFSHAVSHPRIWDFLTDAQRDSILVGVPQTYPVQPLRGHLVAGILTPDTTCDYTYPPELKSEVNTMGYDIDIPDFRRLPLDELVAVIQAMTRKRFRVFRRLLTTRKWDFAMVVEIGLDRLQHCFWKFLDETHPLYSAANPYRSVIPDYYRLLDEEIDATLSLVPDDTAIFIVSDHGAQAMQGGVRINQWLMNEGYLHLFYSPAPHSEPDRSGIDWTRTQAWGEGGYYSRIFLNVQDREPSGTIPQSQYNAVRQLLAEKLRNMTGPDGKKLGNRVLIPEQTYSTVNGIAPDLMVYLGDMAWRSLAEFHPGSIFSLHNDHGPDGANHALHGVFVTNLALKTDSGPVEFNITDIAPTVLELLKIKHTIPMDGRILDCLAGIRTFSNGKGEN